MKVRCMTEYDNEVHQWVAMSLEFGLAAQADTESEAKQKLIAQITDYFEEAFGNSFQEQLLNRKAPFSWYIHYYWLVLKNSCRRNEKSPLFYQATPDYASHA